MLMCRSMLRVCLLWVTAGGFRHGAADVQGVWYL